MFYTNLDMQKVIENATSRYWFSMFDVEL